MPQNHEGAMKVAAKRCGVSPEEYAAKTAAGLKHCMKCRMWKPRCEFNRDATRYDGLNPTCRACKMVKVRKVTKGRPSAFKGRTHTEEAKARMRACRQGRPSSKKGVPRTPEVRAKISRRVREVMPKGADCWWTYKDGKYYERRAFRFTPEYKKWRRDVYERDGFACQLCGDNRGGNLNAHHIFAYAAHPDLRVNLDNGITLCELCHDRLHHKPDSIRNKRKQNGLIRRLKLRK
jgi:5-methylcytosine-specific restriction endonuclease McrA